ncbi:MAG: lysozyme family protein [Muricomes sp.]
MVREIKTRRIYKDIKALDKTITVTDHMKHAFVRTKDTAEKTQPQTQEQSTPEGYAGEKVMHTIDSARYTAVRQLGKLGKRGVYAAKEKYQVAKETRNMKQAIQESHVDIGGDSSLPPSFAGRENTSHQTKDQIWKRGQALSQKKTTGHRVSEVRKVSEQAVKTLERGEKTIKTAGKMERTVKNAGKGMVKCSGKSVKTAERTAHTTIKTTHEAAKAAQVAARVSTRTAQRAIKVARIAEKAAEQAVKAAVKTTSSAVKAIIAATKTLVTAIAAGGWMSVLILILIVLFGGILCITGGGNSRTVTPVSEEVNAYEPVIRQYAKQYGVGEYVELIKAVMMQESGGWGSDPMQSAESSFNTRFPRQPNGITEPEYSIQCGVQVLKSCLESADVENPLDMDQIKLALQGYNFGNGYITWAKNNYGGYTAVNAAEFSDMMAQRMGWSGYGDKHYVPHVLRYYVFGRIPTSVGNQAIVQIALSQEGNVGGQPYWSWYGFGSRVEWCACFVSWCAQQCGYIDSGIMPKFALCSNGVSWFQQKGQWQDGNYVPAGGDIIFFDWGNDGSIDHVGIVEKCEDGVVYTIEGNSGDRCQRRNYAIGYGNIYGYGLVKY